MSIIPVRPIGPEYIPGRILGDVVRRGLDWRIRNLETVGNRAGYDVLETAIAAARGEARNANDELMAVMKWHDRFYVQSTYKYGFSPVLGFQVSVGPYKRFGNQGERAFRLHDDLLQALVGAHHIVRNTPRSSAVSQATSAVRITHPASASGTAVRITYG